MDFVVFIEANFIA